MSDNDQPAEQDLIEPPQRQTRPEDRAVDDDGEHVEDSALWAAEDEDAVRWMEESAAADHKAADYLRKNLIELLSSLSGTPLHEAEPRLREALADSHAPEARYFLRASGWEQGLPESDIWLTAAAATASPTEDPGTPVEDQAVVGAMQHADWLGLVIGLSRRGPGARLDAKRAQRDIRRLDDIGGEIEDPEGHLDILDSAIEVLVPLWEFLGIIDGERRLTALGQLGLPLALMGAWDPQPEEDDLHPDVERAALAVLAEGPQSLEDLRRRLARQGIPQTLAALRDGIGSHRDVWVFGYDDAYGHVPTFLQGVIVTHRVTERELSMGLLDAGPDLDVYMYLADEGGCPLAGGGLMTARWRRRGVEMPGDSGVAFGGPDGWLDSCSPGDVFGLRYRDGVLSFEAVDEDKMRSATHADERDRIADVIEDTIAFDEENADTEILGAGGSEVFYRLLRERPGSLHEPLPPLSELAVELGYTTRRGYVCRSGAAGGVGAPPRLSAEQRSARQAWVRLARDWRKDGAVPDAEGLASVAAALGDSDLMGYLTLEVVADPGLDPLLEAMQQAVDGALTALPLRLRGAAAEARGDTAGFRAYAEAAAAADPQAADPFCSLGDLAAAAGDAHEAERLYRLGGLSEGSPEIDHLRAFLKPPADGPGRNKPCPCGSGKKYKMCHGRTAVHPLPSRAEWLWYKLTTFAGRPPFRNTLLRWGGLFAGVEADTPAAAAEVLQNPLALDFAVFEGGLVQKFLERMGDLLPADERELAARWAEQPVRLLEVREVLPARGAALADLLTGDEIEVVNRRLSQTIREKDVLFAYPLDDGSGTLRFMSVPCKAARRLRSRLLSLLRQGAPAEELAAALVPGAPAVESSDGQPFAACSARYDIADPDVSWSALAAELSLASEGSYLRLLDESSRVLGTVVKDGDQILLEANSAERLQGLQDVLLRAIPSSHLADESAAPYDPADPRPSRIGTADEQRESHSPEALTRAFEARWLDDATPLLGGLTPREAAAGERRADLAALLDDFDWQNGRYPDRARMDTARLRRELGLDI